MPPPGIEKETIKSSIRQSGSWRNGRISALEG